MACPQYVWMCMSFFSFAVALVNVCCQPLISPLVIVGHSEIPRTGWPDTSLILRSAYTERTPRRCFPVDILWFYICNLPTASFIHPCSSERQAVRTQVCGKKAYPCLLYAFSHHSKKPTPGKPDMMNAVLLLPYLTLVSTRYLRQ